MAGAGGGSAFRASSLGRTPVNGSPTTPSTPSTPTCSNLRPKPPGKPVLCPSPPWSHTLGRYTREVVNAMGAWSSAAHAWVWRGAAPLGTRAHGPHLCDGAPRCICTMLAHVGAPQTVAAHPCSASLSCDNPQRFSQGADVCSWQRNFRHNAAFRNATQALMHLTVP